MDELVDILDDGGNFTGKTAMKSEAHKHGLFHPTVHVWFYTANGQVLLQQRSRDKEIDPLLWGVSVAGHVSAGENIEASALREVHEEIGLSINKGQLHKIGVFKSIRRYNEDLIDSEFHHTYLCELEVPFPQLRKQDSEVEALELIPLLRFSEETWGLANLRKYIPQGVDYYRTVIEAIKKRL
ncbi:MAG: hydrolase [Maribacter sp.]|nr:MAG: hydrolase [Maribacter sp.]